MNRIGVQTLIRREIGRFLVVPSQTLAQPIVITALYLLVFGQALGAELHDVGGLPYARYIVPGLVALGVLQNAFLNSASSLFVGKLQGTILDLLVAPLSPGELLAGFCVGSMVRGLLVGIMTLLVAAPFIGLHVDHPLFTLAMLLLIAQGFAALGVIVAIRSDKFEQLNLVPTFILTPLTFFGGVFNDPTRLSPTWQWLVRLDPIFYLVDGLRYGMESHASTPPALGLAVALATNVLLTGTAYLLLRRGDKLRT